MLYNHNLLPQVFFFKISPLSLVHLCTTFLRQRLFEAFLSVFNGESQRSTYRTSPEGTCFKKLRCHSIELDFRLGHSGSQSGFGFVQSGFSLSDLSKSAPFGLYESSVWYRFGFCRFGSGLVNLQQTGTTRCTFGFGSQLVLWLKNNWYVSSL